MAVALSLLCGCDAALICGDGHKVAVEDCDDGNVAGRDGCSATCKPEAALRLSWRLTDRSGVEQPCPEGVSYAMIVTWRDEAPSQGLSDRFACADHAGTLWREPGEIVYVVSFMRADLSVYGETLPARTTLAIGPPAERTATLKTGVRYVKAAWRIVDAAGAELTCAQANASSLHVTGHAPSLGAGTESLHIFRCELLGAYVGPLAPDTDHLGLTLYDVNGLSVGWGPGASVSLEDPIPKLIRRQDIQIPGPPGA
jgi:cysteine-rich repeat protein